MARPGAGLGLCLRLRLDLTFDFAPDIPSSLGKDHSFRPSPKLSMSPDPKASYGPSPCNGLSLLLRLRLGVVLDWTGHLVNPRADLTIDLGLASSSSLNKIHGLG